MSIAINEAMKAYDLDEIPVGAIVVKDNKIIGKGFNRVEGLKDPTAHAEIIAITAACNTIGSKVLEDCDIYVTLEPCVMCTGAIMLSKIKNLYFGAFEPKFGACGSLFNIIEDKKNNHAVNVFSGLNSDVVELMLKDYFNHKRTKNN